MTLPGSALLFLASVVGFIGFSAYDKKRGQDRFRVAVLLCGVMGLLALFYLLLNLAAWARSVL
jgi:hypothetical protein